MSRPRIEFSRRLTRWLAGAALFALAPKCLLCLTGYLGLATALGLGGRELCGATASAAGGLAGLACWI